MSSLNQQISAPRQLRLDEFIRLLIQADGIDFVANHYIDLREEYYDQHSSYDQGVVKENCYV